MASEDLLTLDSTNGTYKRKASSGLTIDFTTVNTSSDLNVDGTATLGGASSSATHLIRGDDLQLKRSTAADTFVIARDVSTGAVELRGDSTAFATGGRIVCYGSSHASKASTIELILGAGVVGTGTSAGLTITGNVIAEKASSGSAVNLTVSNTANTSGSDAIQKVKVGGTSGGDAGTHYEVDSTTDYLLGIDNSDSDSFKLVPSNTFTSQVPLIKSSFGRVSIASTQIGPIVNARFEFLTPDYVLKTSSGGTVSTDDPIHCIFYSSTGGTAQVTLAFTDSSYATIDVSTITGTFGTTTGVAWNNDMPWYLYLVNTSNLSSGIRMAIARRPNLCEMPATGLIAYEGNAATTDSDNAVFLATATDERSAAAAKPMSLIGGFRLIKSSGDVWSSPGANPDKGDGLSPTPFNGCTLFDMPTGQNGAASGSYFRVSSGSAPTWSQQLFKYSILHDGRAKVVMRCRGTCTFAGTGATVLRGQFPISADINPYTVNGYHTPIGWYTASSAATPAGILIGNINGDNDEFSLHQIDGTNLDANDLSNSSDRIEIEYTYYI